MSSETRQWGARRSQTDPAFTTRPRRLLIIGRVQPGHEQELLDAHGSLPSDIAIDAGIGAIEAFVGSGHYGLLLEIDGENAQDAMAAYLNDPRVREFRALIQPLVTGLPGPEWEYVPSDPFHQATNAPGARSDGDGPAYSSADLPLAASIFHWRRE